MKTRSFLMTTILLYALTAVSANAGTIARWNFEEGAGSAFTTIYGFRNSGVLVNQLTFSNDTRLQTLSKYSLSFDGQNGIAIVPDHSSLRVQKAITIEAWVKPGPNARVIVGKQFGIQCCANSYQLELNPFRFQLTDSSGQDYLIGPDYEPSEGSWHHIAGTWDGTNMRLYLDFVEVACGTFSGPIGYDINPVLIGGEDDAAGIPGCCAFDGLIDDVRISDKALTPSLFLR